VSATSIAPPPAPAPQAVEVTGVRVRSVAASKVQAGAPPVQAGAPPAATISSIATTTTTSYAAAPWVTRLAQAAVQPDPTPLDALLRAPAGPVDAVDAQGRTALWLAVQAGRTDNVRRLVDAGADPAKRDADGLSPAALAQRLGRADLSAILDAPPTGTH
jgi:hypothetical protein